MTMLLAGETVSGALLQSLAPGLRSRTEVDIVDTWGPGVRDAVGARGRVLRQRDKRNAGKRIVEAVAQLSPSAVLIIKGRGVDAASIDAIRAMGVPVACYYPDNPWWTREQEPEAFERLLACDLAVTFSQWQASKLSKLGANTAVLPFGYDPRWFPLQDPSSERDGIVFLGTWSHRRQRFLAELVDLPFPLVVHGTGWDSQDEVPSGAPITESGAGDLLGKAVVGVNLLHPQCAESHNMRTREITASGALQLSDPGADGSPLVDGESFRVFRSPQHLRELVIEAFEDRESARVIAAEGQRLTAEETYFARGSELFDLMQGLA